jgi:hypothetical protein
MIRPEDIREMGRLGVPEQVIRIRSANQASLRPMGFAPSTVTPYTSPFGGMQDSRLNFWRPSALNGQRLRQITPAHAPLTSSFT